MCAKTHAGVFSKSVNYMYMYACIFNASRQTPVENHLLSLALQSLHPRVLLLRRFAVNDDALLAVSVEQLDAVLYLNTEGFV